MTWLIWLLVGFSAGVIVGVLIDRDTVYKGIWKIKQRGRQNVQRPNVNANMGGKDGKFERLQRKLERKKQRELRRLEKNK